LRCELIASRGAVSPAALRHLRDRAVYLGKPRVDIGERVGLRVDPGRERSGLSLYGSRRAHPVAEVGRHELRIDTSGVDGGQPRDQDNQHRS
jgi:hypothetical protein